MKKPKTLPIVEELRRILTDPLARARDKIQACNLISESTRDPHIISLRDLFAGLAMQGMIAINIPIKAKTRDKALRSLSAIAYDMADAMLKAREKKA